MKRLFILLLLPVSLQAQKFSPGEIQRWQSQANQVTITRDTWGIPHVSGKTDADAVFGMLYAQCEDDFPRVERNYIKAVARLAEAEGEEYIYQDLRMRLFMDSAKAISIFNESPDWLKKLCFSFSDGINYYLYTHPETKPKLISRFQPWMPLLFSEGSIGGDIESIPLEGIRELYDKRQVNIKKDGTGDGDEPEPKGSNGFAIAASKSATGNAFLYINPHTSFYFRSEIQVTSEEGLNAYGAVTWGQFFIYQGFNAHCGWMHTTSAADVIDGYEEMISKKDGVYFSKYGNEQKKVESEKVVLKYKSKSGISSREFTVFRTHHGPVVEESNGKWISVRIMQEPLKALSQSFLRTKSNTFEEFKKVMELRTNSSNNTVYADDQKNIAYWHGNFMPKRDPKFNWNNVVDGSDPATEWKGLHPVDEVIHIYNPVSGWIQNCNSTPFTASGTSSPLKSDYPTYMSPDFENARGIHAVQVLKDEKAFTLDKLIAAGHDSYLPGFKDLVPSLLQAFQVELSAHDTLTRYKEPIEVLSKWDLRYSSQSVATTLAIYWAQQLRQSISSRIPPESSQLTVIQILQTGTSPGEKTKAFAKTINDLNRDFGSWKQPWGEINRYQRITAKIESTFDDQKFSISVPFTSSFWGSLAAFGSRKYPGTKKMYGSVGNSFVAAVEFGQRVQAKSVVSGGSSGNPESPHFTDQATRYASGQFKDVWFYKEDLAKHTERTYHPGEK